MAEDADSLLSDWLRNTGMWRDYPPRLLHCYAEWLQAASPDQWHQAAESYNWTYGSAPMHWIVSQRDCDLATAVLLYYLSGPSYYWEFTPGNVPDHAREGFPLVWTARTRVAAGDYKRAEIAFDPTYEFATEIRDAPISDDPEFPSALPGRPVPRPLEWNDGFPDEVWQCARTGVIP